LQVLGARSAGFKDLYHYLLRTSWSVALGWAAVGFVAINAIYATAYFTAGGINGAHNWLDCFFFSVETSGTIGYGNMFPDGRFAEGVMTAEAFTALIYSAVITGLCFAKFARPTSRVLWSKICVVSDRDGVPTLMFRVANERRNHVVEANVRVAVIRIETTQEGEKLRRVIDLPLMRQSTPSFVLSWTVMHVLDEKSPLFGLTQDGLRKIDAEIVVTLTGLDETLMQTIHSRTSYLPEEIIYGARFADVLSSLPDGRRAIDYRKFHDYQPAKITWERLGAKAPIEATQPPARA
jgi:inward rectifier potassium channel